MMEHPNHSSESNSNLAVTVREPKQRTAPFHQLENRPPVQETQDDSDATGLLTYWRIINRRKWTLLLFIVLGTLLGFATGLPKTPMYQARASLEVLSLNEDFLNMKQSNPTTTADYSFETSELQTQIRLIKSDSLIDRVLAKMNSANPPEKHAAKTPASVSAPEVPMAAWRKFLHLPERAPLSRKLLVQQAAESLKVSATARTRIIEITVDSVDPKFAADFVNTLANEYIQNNLQARWESNQKTGEWLSRELDQARAKLQRSEMALQTYARESGLIFTSADSNISSEKLQQLQHELSAATGDRISKQSRYELAQHASPNTLPDVLNDSGLRGTASRITELQREIANLSATFTPEYNKVKRAEAELATLQAAFERDRSDILARIGNEYQESMRKEKLLAAAYDVQIKEVTGQGAKSIQYNILKREADSNRQIYDTMLQQLKQSTIASAVSASNARIVDPAKVPDFPFSPNFRTSSILGLVAGLFGGLLLIVMRELGNRTLQEPGDAQFWTGLPELGTIPSASADEDKKIEGKRSAPGSIDLPAAESKKLFHVGGKKNPGDSANQKHKRRLVAEAFRSVLTSILFASDTGNELQVLVVTSANPSEGKTTVVTNLGIATAEIGKTVLMIDADLRRPRIHNFFDVPNERGLSTLLRQSPLPEDALDGIIQETPVPGLHVLPSGPPTQTAANLLYSPNLRELLKKFQKQYDIVLIDTPPMLQLPDARIIGRAADAVIIVARAEHTTRDAMIAAYQRFTADRIHLLGTVLNDWNPKKSIKGYYGYGGGAYEKVYQRYAAKGAS